MTESKQIDWQKQLKKLERYCNKKGYAVLYRDVKLDVIYFDEKKIVLSNCHSDEISLYYLLHEIGHHVIINKKRYSEEYQEVYDTFSKSSATNKLTNVQEELDAWREGLKLANRLGISVDRRKFEITKSRCILTYLNWISNRQ